MEKTKSGIIQSVDRALRIIEVMYSSKKELGVTELAEKVGLHKSTAFGLLNTLENRGFVTQNKEKGKYELGLKFVEIGSEIIENMDERQIIRPYLKDLAEKYQETVHYTIEDDNRVVYVDKIESPRALVINSYIGKRNPMHCTGVGKCLLAFMSEGKQEKILRQDLERYTDNTIIDSKTLRKELTKIQNNGYSIDNEEIEIGLRCIAAPVFDFKGNLLGGISISGPTTRMTEERIKELIEPLKSTASKISNSLGYYKKI